MQNACTKWEVGGKNHLFRGPQIENLLAPFRSKRVSCGGRMQSIRSHEEIVSYYDTCEWDYQFVWHTSRSLALHYGFWTQGIRSLIQAQENQNRWMAQAIDINGKDRVLDAGCGVGGSSIYLAQTYGCECTGISLSQRQVNRATESARRKKIPANFQVQDFNRTSFRSESFSVVWAIESICHTANKEAFLTEAYRLLAPGGRLIVADGFSTTPMESLESEQKDLMRGWLEPWAVDSLATTEEFVEFAARAGFENIQSQDVTNLVIPSARKLNSRAIMATIPAHLMYWIGLRNEIQHGNYTAGKYQWRALQRKLWQYGVFMARKPGSAGPGAFE